MAELTADVDDLARQSRLAARAALAQERDRIAALEATVLRFSRAVDPAVTCELLAAGYHRHDRRPWRRRRGGR